jgi:hypothetical protein
MTREEPSLEMLWLQNIETMHKVQRTDRHNGSDFDRDRICTYFPKEKIFITTTTVDATLQQ